MRAYRIVVFHVAIAGDSRDALGGISGVDQLNLLHRSAIRTNPGVVFTLLTSPDTDLTRLTFPHERIDAPVDPSRIMFERSKMQRDYLAATRDTLPIAFLDSDMLLAGDLSDVFDGGFDIGLTWRQDDSMPFNGGVILADVADRAASLGFFDAFLERYRSAWDGRAEWYGDQNALADLVGMRALEIAAAHGVTRAGARIRFLPCDVYNYDPSSRSRILLRLPAAPILFHFKGTSRRLMAPVWDLCLSANRAGGAPWLIRLWAALKFRLTKRAYRHRLRADRRRSSAGGTPKAGPDRTELAVELIARAATHVTTPPRIAEIGCGDTTLASALDIAGIRHHHAGYDRGPRHPGVEPLDISRSPLPQACDVAVALGLIGETTDAAAALARLRQSAAWLVIGHDGPPAEPIAATTVTEIEALIRTAGWSMVEHRITADRHSALWLCSAS